jgi:hypothetical protein
MCVCASQKSFFRRRTFAPTQERGASAPRGFTTATAPASVSTLPAVSRDFAEAPLQSRYGNHGGLTPAALGRGFANRQTMFEFRGRASGSPSHGGLTPAAPGWMCVCASQKSFFRRRTSASQYKSGGRKPPVGTINANATAIRTRTVASPPNKRACVRERVSHIHGGLTFAALLDNDDRRSRRNRFPLQVRYSHPRRVDVRGCW